MPLCRAFRLKIGPIKKLGGALGCHHKKMQSLPLNVSIMCVLTSNTDQHTEIIAQGISGLLHAE